MEGNREEFTSNQTPSVVTADSPLWLRPQPTNDQLRADVFIAVGLFCCAILSLTLFQHSGFFEVPAHPVVSVSVLGVVTLSLAWRRRRPLAVTAISAGGMILGGELYVSEVLVLNISLFLALYTLGAWSRHRRAARLMRWGVIAAMAGWFFVAFVRTSLDPELETVGAGAMTPALSSMLYILLVNILYFSAAIWFGHSAWDAARARAQSEEKSQKMQRDREALAEQAVALERLHIARELHDSVAHHVSLMGVQSAAARMVLRKNPDQAESSMRLVEDSARRAVTELHQLLGTLRQRNDATLRNTPATNKSADEAASGDPTSAHQPSTAQPSAQQPSTAQPEAHRPMTEQRTTPANSETPLFPDAQVQVNTPLGLAHITELVAEAKSAGMALDFHTIGTEQAVSSLAGLALYRIAQEALTNVRKHAGVHAYVEMRLRYHSHTVELEVGDDGGSGRSRTASIALRTGLPAPDSPSQPRSVSSDQPRNRSLSVRSSGPYATQISGNDGHGIIGMRERAHAAGGTLIVSAVKGGGFSVLAEVPYHAAPAQRLAESSGPAVNGVENPAQSQTAPTGSG